MSFEVLGNPNVVSWITLDDHFKTDEHARKKRFWLVKAYKYHWMVVEVIWTPSTLNSIMAITNADIMVGNQSERLVLLLDLIERICISFEG